MKNTHVTLTTRELLEEQRNLCTDCSNEQIAAAMLLLASTNAELARLNNLYELAEEKHDSAMLEKYDNEFSDFSIAVAFKNHTVRIELGNMDVFDAFCSFLMFYANNAELYK